MAIPNKIFGVDTKVVGLALLAMILIAVGEKYHINWLIGVGLFVMLIAAGRLMVKFFM